MLENSQIAWKQWLDYKKNNQAMTIAEQQEIMEEIGVFDEFDSVGEEYTDYECLLDDYQDGQY